MSWKKIDSKIIFENDWMTVLEDRVINPGGGTNDYGHVRFKNRAVAILPIASNDDTWLVGQDRYTLGEWSWELPMGGAPLDEDLLSAAKRELKEETGLSAKRWTEVMRLHLSNSITDEYGVGYIAQDLSEGPTEFEETEKLEIRRLPLEEAIGMALAGEISDALSVALLLRMAVVKTVSGR